MKKIRRRHTPEFKREAVALVTEQGYFCAEAGRSLMVHPTNIARWRRELAEAGSEGAARLPVPPARCSSLHRRTPRRS